MAFQVKIESFLAPIPGSCPSGENLRYTQVYDRIKEARREDDEFERGEWQTELKRADWHMVIKICSEALIKKTKDLQIALWLTEALLHKQGFAGLGVGLELMSKLMIDFWDTLYPEIEDGDLDFRIGPLVHLNEKFPIAIWQVPLCDPKQTPGYGYAGWEESQVVGSKNGLDRKQLKEYTQLVEEGKVSADDFNSAVTKSSLGFYKTLHGQITQCLDNIEVLDKVVTHLFANDPLGFSRLKDSVMGCMRIVEKIFTEKKRSEVADDEDDILEANDIGETPQTFAGDEDMGTEMVEGDLFLKKNAIYDISNEERNIWRIVTGKAGNGQLKSALDQLMAASALAPSERQKNRYLLLVARLCINAGRYDLAQPIVERLYQMIETLNLEKWEHPTWISEVVEALYRCLENDSNGKSDRARQLFQKLCTLNVTKAATFRVDSGQ